MEFSDLLKSSGDSGIGKNKISIRWPRENLKVLVTKQNDIYPIRQINK